MSPSRSQVCRSIQSAVVLAFLPALIPLPPAAQAEPPITLQAVCRSLGIELILPVERFTHERPYGNIHGAPAPPDALQRYRPLLAAELSRYPRPIIHRARLKRMVLCTDLKFSEQRRNAVPDSAGDTLYLEVVRGAGNSQYLRRVTHHDFYHMIDLRDDGRLYQDDTWAALNPTGFRYGKGGNQAQHDRHVGALTTDHPGFLTRYATTGVEEDKAELFSYLMVQPDLVAKRARKDPILMAKIQRLEKLMRAFCPSLEQPLWQLEPKREANR